TFTLTSTDEGNVKAEIVLGDEEEDPVEAELWEAEIINFRLTATPTSQIVGEDGKAPITFKLEMYSSLTGEWSPVQGKTLTFTAVGGSCPASGVTAPDGTVDITFTAEENFTEGSVTAEFKTNVPIVWGGSVKAEITAPEEEDDSNEGQLKKAKRLGENVVRIGEEVVEIIEDERDYVSIEKSGESYTVDWTKGMYPEGDPVGVTISYGVILGLTESMLGQMIEMSSEAWGNILVEISHLTNPEAEQDFVWIDFSHQNIVNGAIRLTRNSSTQTQFTRSSGNDYYTIQIYLKRDDGLEMWANLKTTSSNT
ncbi:MAG: hypothetical protein QM237_09025, partial [Bacteroidota bacterium]|nr:hypothetical protein [Bacteroidota bacterium]